MCEQNEFMEYPPRNLGSNQLTYLSWVVSSYLTSFNVSEWILILNNKPLTPTDLAEIRSHFWFWWQCTIIVQSLDEKSYKNSYLKTKIQACRTKILRKVSISTNSIWSGFIFRLIGEKLKVIKKICWLIFGRLK